jgi:hypothetical protein
MLSKVVTIQAQDMLQFTILNAIKVIKIRWMVQLDLPTKNVQSIST